MSDALQQLSFRIDGRDAVLIRYAGADSLVERLTSSEHEVAELALHGHSNRGIARLRGTSMHTVSNQLRSVYRKLGIRARSELASAIAGAAGGNTGE